MLVVVGGPGRNAGKTSVVTGLIRAIPEASWTAVKISLHSHGPGGEPYELREEREPGGTDAGRYVAAGAARSFWLRTAGPTLEPAAGGIRKLLAGSGNAIVESNSIIGLIQPDLYLVVMDGSVQDIKDSLRRFLPRADALVVVGPGDLPAGFAEGKPRFHVGPPGYTAPELVECVRARLRRAEATRAR